MEYGEEIESIVLDQNNYRHIGWKEENNCNQGYYTQDNIKMISQRLSELLKDVDQDGKQIIVTEKVIINAMNTTYTNYRPQVCTQDEPIDIIQEMLDQTIENIASEVRTNIKQDQNNQKLTIWTTLYGDFNKHGLRSHPIIKLRKKRPAPMQFHMNY